MKQYKDKQWLHDEYITKNRPAQDISNECGTCVRTILKYTARFDLRKQPVEKKFAKNKVHIIALYKDKEWLYQKYVVEKIGPKKIGKLCGGINFRHILKWVNKFQFPVNKQKGKYKDGNHYAKARHMDQKQKAIDYKGGKCEMCGYNKCIAAMTFHHNDPSEKEYRPSELMSCSFERIKKEIDKCKLLCFNCHMEYHFYESDNIE